jgi:butyrate response factor 1
MSGWYTTRDTSTWFEASDSQAWVPTNQQQNIISSKYANFTHHDLPLKNGKSEINSMSKQMKLENRRTFTCPLQTDQFFELPKLMSDQNAWNAYVLSNTNYACEAEGVQDPLKPEKVLFSKYKRNVDIEEELTKQNLFKTELCQSWIETGACRYGPKCQFAHGKDELRPVIRHPKYKTEICKTFSTSGQCPYGKRCRFVHQLTELRADPDPEEELVQLQLKLQEINLSLAPDPVFPAAHRGIVMTPVKKGSRLPFLQKIRKSYEDQGKMRDASFK